MLDFMIVSSQSTMPERGFRARIEEFVSARWYGKAGVLNLLLPFEYLYVALAGWRRKKSLAQRSQAVRLPTVVVGNLVAGGTGKTPVVAEIVTMLQRMGSDPAIVTRGYGGTSAQWPMLVTDHSDPVLCGDEACELAQVTGVPVVAGPDRVASIDFIRQNLKCDIVVSDDGLQHYAMARDLEVVLIDAARRFGNGHRIPVGPLRESPMRLMHSDLVFVTSSGLSESRSAIDPIAAQINQHICANSQQVASLYPLSLTPCAAEQLIGATDSNATGVGDGSLAGAPFVGESCIALSGIGSPQRFHDDLRALGCTVKPIALADHQDYRGSFDVATLERLCAQHWVVTTAKDATKLRHLLGETRLDNLASRMSKVWVLRRRVEFSTSGKEKLLAALHGLAEGSSPAEGSKGDAH